MLDYKLAEKFIKLKQNTKNELGNGTEKDVLFVFWRAWDKLTGIRFKSLDCSLVAINFATSSKQ